MSSAAWELDLQRARAVRRGQQLQYLTIGYNCLEGLIAVVAGFVAGSIALVGFGFDSGIEVIAGAAVLWRLRADVDQTRRQRAERISLRIVGLSFVILAAYVVYESVGLLLERRAPRESLVGIALAALSVVVMPVLARAKRRVASSIDSRAMSAEARQTDFCAYLSAILLAGLLLNALAGWWWADPAAALVMTLIIAREGILALRARPTLRPGQCC